MKRLLASVVGVCLAMAGGRADGVVTWGNMEPAVTRDNAFGPMSGTNQNAIQFTSKYSIYLSGLEVAIARHWGVSGAQAAVVQLWADAGNVPGTLLESWNVMTPNTDVPSAVGVTSGTGAVLRGGSKYWVVVGATGQSAASVSWFFASVNEPTGPILTGGRLNAGDAWTTVQRTRGFGARVSGEITGDVNEDGRIDGDDYARLDRGRAMGLKGRANGDLNLDNVVDQADYLIVDRDWIRRNMGVPSAPLMAEREAQFGAGYVGELVSAVPEPGTGGVVVGIAVVAGVRRRK